MLNAEPSCLTLSEPRTRIVPLRLSKGEAYPETQKSIHIGASLTAVHMELIIDAVGELARETSWKPGR